MPVRVHRLHLFRIKMFGIQAPTVLSECNQLRTPPICFKNSLSLSQFEHLNTGSSNYQTSKGLVFKYLRYMGVKCLDPHYIAFLF